MQFLERVVVVRDHAEHVGLKSIAFLIAMLRRRARLVDVGIAGVFRDAVGDQQHDHLVRRVLLFPTLYVRTGSVDRQVGRCSALRFTRIELFNQLLGGAGQRFDVDRCIRVRLDGTHVGVFVVIQVVVTEEAKAYTNACTHRITQEFLHRFAHGLNAPVFQGVGIAAVSATTRVLHRAAHRARKVEHHVDIERDRLALERYSDATRVIRTW